MIGVVHQLSDLSGWLPVRSNRQVMLSDICMEETATGAYMCEFDV
jgi:hypothetical protein